MTVLKQIPLVVLGTCAALSFILCTLVPVSQMFSSGSAEVGCLQISGTPDGVSEMVIPDAEWRIFPPSIVCDWPTEAGAVMRTVEPLTPLSFPLLLGIQIAFILVLYLRHRSRKASRTDARA